MSHIWTFAPSSEALLKRCIEAAAPEDPENKWVKHFKRKQTNLSISNHETDADNVKNITEAVKPVPDTTKDINPVVLDLEINESFLECSEADPISRIDFIIEECIKNQNVIIRLAENLSGGAVEKICNHLFNKKDIDVAFLDNFYQSFFPAYLKREYSLFSLDLLVKAEKSNPVQFKKLLQILFKNLEITSKVVQDFYQSLNEQQKSEFMSNLLEIDLSTEEFSHHLFTIYIAYKESKKNERINNFLLQNLVRNSESCADDKNYGRLVLSYLQTQKENPGSNVKKLEKVIEMNRTPFMKPCLKIFNEILEKCYK